MSELWILLGGALLIVAILALDAIVRRQQPRRRCCPTTKHQWYAVSRRTYHCYHCQQVYVDTSV